MNLIQLQNKFNTHNKCVKHLEKVRWNGHPVCPHCNSDSVTPRAFKPKNKLEEFRNTPMYHCNKCNKDFTVLYGTIFEGSKMPLTKWFLLISLMLHARKGISAMNLMRNLGVTYKTAWYSAMRVRCAMLDQADMLEGVVEMDESYFGGKPRKRNPLSHVANIGYTDVNTDDWQKGEWIKNKRGRGANKVKVVGIVERGENGRVAMRVQDSLTGADLLKTLKRYVDMDKNKTTVMTDDFRSYNAFDKEIQHYTVNHSKKEYVKYLKGVKEKIHTNTIEGVWSIIKNSIRGQYHVLSKKYLPFYLAEAAYRYNRRSTAKKATAFDETILNTVSDEKCSVSYKPKKYPRFLAYRPKKKKTKNRHEPFCIP